MGFSCKDCNGFVFDADRLRHACPPFYLVWKEGWHGDDDDGDRIRSRTHEDAAEKWAEDDDRDSAEYSIVSGGETVDVRVRLESNPADEKWFNVRGESVPQYYAEEIQRPQPTSANAPQPSKEG